MPRSARLITLNQMRASEEVTEEQSRQVGSSSSHPPLQVLTA